MTKVTTIGKFEVSDKHSDETIKLVNQIDEFFQGKNEDVCKDALLTCLTWWIADCVRSGANIDEFIDAIGKALKESVKIQIASNQSAMN